MDLFNGLINLINEHASSTVLKDRIAFLKDKFTSLELELSNALAKAVILESDKQTLQMNLQQAKIEIRNLKEQLSIIHSRNPDSYVCDHCGSPSLTRTGSRTDPTFGDLGIKQKLFTCDACGKESAFTPSDKEI